MTHDCANGWVSVEDSDVAEVKPCPVCRSDWKPHDQRVQYDPELAKQQDAEQWWD